MECPTLTLPWPPSVNTYWRHARGRTYLAERGRQYRRLVFNCVLWQNYGRTELDARLALYIEACPPDRRTRDLDNLLKGPLDAMAAAGLYDDDGQIDDLHIVRGERVKGGALRVRITAL